MQKDMTGKTALVTGAARGIGLAVAKAFADAGAAVLMTDVLEAEGMAAAEAISKAGGKASFMKHDVREDEVWAQVTAAAISRYQGLDFVINNAGIETASLMVDFDPADIRRIFDINVLGVMLGVKHAFRAMRPDGAAGKGGAIVNIASAAAVMSGTGLSAYSATKAAVAHFTRNAAVEAGALGYGVRVNCIMPGMIETHMATQLGDHFAAMGLVESEAALRASSVTKAALHRYGQPSEIASVVHFLCSDASSYMTGVSFAVDGAISLG